MSRSPKEWIAKSDDAKIPPRVRLRVFDRAGGVCHLCKLKIKVPGETWDADHIKALINGGAHREANLAPAHKHCHLIKTTADVAEKKKVAAVRKKHVLPPAPKQPIKSPGFRQSKHAAKREARAKDALPPLQPRAMFVPKELPAHER